MRLARPALVAAALAAAGGVVVAGAGAGSGGQSRAELTAGDLAGPPAADQAVTIASEGWQRLTRRPVPSLRSLGGAHPGAKSIRVNRDPGGSSPAARGRQRFPYPAQTVIVKTATRDGGAEPGGDHAQGAGRLRRRPRGATPSTCAAGDGLHQGRRRPVALPRLPRLGTDVQRSDWVFYRLS